MHSQEWLCYAEDGVIVGFGAAAREDDFLGLGSDEGGNLFAGGFDGGAGALAGRVDRRGVGKVGGEIGKHRVEDLRVDGGGGVVIEIDAVHGLVTSILRNNDSGRVTNYRWSPSDWDCVRFSSEEYCKKGKKRLQ